MAIFNSYFDITRGYIYISALIPHTSIGIDAELDVFIGDQGLVTAPHWSRPPMSRLSLEPHELGTPIGLPWYAG